VAVDFKTDGLEFGKTMKNSARSSCNAAREPSLAIKLLAGAPDRRTRFHDATGQLTPIGRILRNAPRGLATAVLRLALGRLPVRPWLSYDAQDLIEAHLTSESRVLEFGSGMSTRWFAARAGRVVSIENSPEWHQRIRSALPQRDSITYRLAEGEAAYTAIPDGESFDLILVDGRWRDRCVENALDRLRPKGILYLDNADKGSSVDSGDVPRAVALIEEAAERNGWRLQRFTDFAPAVFFAQAGLLLQRD
jgi:SAM-dependent methyltransferase